MDVQGVLGQVRPRYSGEQTTEHSFRPALAKVFFSNDPALTVIPFHGDGESVVDEPRFNCGRVWINASQYFDSAAAMVWKFHISGYRPAQKWLKARKRLALCWDDVRHHQHIDKILAKTDGIMNAIELPIGGNFEAK